MPLILDRTILIEKLRKYKKEDIIITTHAKIQAMIRGVELEEVKENIINPHRLVFAEKQRAEKEDEEKYNCYFGYSKTQCQRYVVAVNEKTIVCTIIKINRRWQYKVEKYGRV